MTIRQQRTSLSLVQTVAPVVAMNLPAAQAVQTLAEVVVPNLPAAQPAAENSRVESSGKRQPTDAGASSSCGNLASRARCKPTYGKTKGFAGSSRRSFESQSQT